MENFIQMDIFFFVTSLLVLIILFFVTILGIYIFIIVNKIKNIVKEFEYLSTYVNQQGRQSFDSIKNKIESILDGRGMMERIIVATLGTILAKVFKSRGKIKKDAPKEK